MTEEKKLSGVPLESIPAVLIDPKCQKCFGRGWTGMFADGSVRPCTCALKELRRRHALAIAEATKEMKK